MRLKLLMVSLLMLGSFSVFGSVQRSAVLLEQESSVLRDLKTVRRYLQGNYVDKALEKVNQMITTLEPGDVKVYSAVGFVTERTGRYFKCDHYNLERAKDWGESLAQKTCYSAGHAQCLTKARSIVLNGAQVIINGINYGYGCRADVVVHGH